MNKQIVAFTCSRSSKQPKSLSKLTSYFNKASIPHYIKLDAPSVFEGYTELYSSVKDNLNPDDIIILCHDDIEVLMGYDEFKSVLNDYLSKSMVGFIGPAGTTHLGKDAMWWHMERRQQGLHRGFVFQGDSLETMTPNYFGQSGKYVVVLDGCFLATTKRVIDDVSLSKPEYLKGQWDFYDIHYTYSAYRMGKFNYAAPIIIKHESNGMMREGWFEAQACFSKQYFNELPARCK